jgi:putative hemolysin
MLSKLLGIEQLDDLYAQLKHDGDKTTFLQRMFERMHVDIRALQSDLERIPKKGGVLAVVNHPFGIVEGAALAYLLPQIRPDVKIMANFLLRSIPEIEDQIIFVDPFGGPAARRANVKGMRESREWLQNGGMLVVFPAGEVSHLQFPQMQVEDPIWSDSIGRLLRNSGASAVPIFIDGRNSVLFHLAGLVHPRLRTAMLPRELWNKQQRTIEVRCGALIPNSRLTRFATDTEMVQHLRWRTYLLGKRNRRRPKSLPSGGRPIAAAIPVPALLREMQRPKLLESGEFDVFAAPGHEIPAIVREIGRLREETFRAVGEGTGKSIDLDSYDQYYHHLFLWNREKQEIVGAYRLGVADEIAAKRGVRGLYTHSLFQFNRDFLRKLGPSVELGRSFVRMSYQRSFQPLLLLWKGIGKFVLAQSPVHVLFGPVSVSAEYTRVSRELIASVLNQQSGNPALASLVRPRKPLKNRLNAPSSCELEELGDLISDMEPDRKSIPVLLRQYLKLGGQLLAFNVDPKFNNCLDGLITVDLAQTELKLLERYMGTREGREFKLLHQNLEGSGAPNTSFHRPV